MGTPVRTAQPPGTYPSGYLPCRYTDETQWGRYLGGLYTYVARYLGVWVPSSGVLPTHRVPSIPCGLNMRHAVLQCVA